jgi:hypothetical protein
VVLGCFKRHTTTGLTDEVNKKQLFTSPMFGKFVKIKPQNKQAVI